MDASALSLVPNSLVLAWSWQSPDLNLRALAWEASEAAEKARKALESFSRKSRPSLRHLAQAAKVGVLSNFIEVSIQDSNSQDLIPKVDIFNFLVQ